jgi:putative nucleotidyltransferase with HDIG domain
MSRFAALVLAAGYSSRMGRFKPLLPLGDKSAVAWATRAFHDGGITDIGVVTGHASAELEPELRRLGVAVLRNPAYDSGMYSSIRAGIASLAPEVDACFLLPVDIPLIRPTTIAALSAHYNDNGPAVLYPRFAGKRGHPPLIARRLFDEILAGDGAGGLRALLARHDAAEIDVADEGILLDMDTPEDYTRLAEMARRRHLPSAAECEAILEIHGVAEPVRRHGRAVAAVALALSRNLDNLDPQLVVAAALLHDIAKGQPAHAEAGAALLAGLGYPELAGAVARHMDFDLGDGQLDTAAVVFIADKLVREDRRIPLEARFQPAFERFAGQPEALAGAQRRYQSALKVLHAIEARAGASCEQLLSVCGVPT